ncbi:MAG TPA: hypothetical protein DHV22_08700 [Xanthomarina gelatinilytica]|uniref:LlaJI family restriction endonuclease n=1 Tax=Xanthomarina gelatinilytica TaxID=1137281 RepID=A0A3D6BRW9_9FLAO|nr:hypothetical protein [Xanthomarina gelatinilytica]
MIEKLIEGKYYNINELELLIGSGYFSLVRSGIIIEKELRAKLNFVGLIFAKKKFCYVLPKYYRAVKEIEINDNEIDLVQESLLIYGQTSFLNTPSLFDEDGVICSPKLQAAINIIRYYFEKGLLAPNTFERSSSYNDRVLWEKTIELTHPIIRDNVPIYVDPVSLKSKRNESHLITEIQKWLTTKAFELVGKMMFPSESISLESNCAEEEKDYYFLVIESYLQNIYSDVEIDLLQNMLRFLNKEIEMQNTEVEVYGTKSFHRIWELANKVLWNDQFENLQQSLPTIIWEYDSASFISTDTIIPDILIKTEDTFFVVDAKYYLPIFRGTKPIGQPGVESITKQFVYEDILRKKYKDLNFKNIFCFPDEKRLKEDNAVLSLSNDDVNGKVNFENSPYNHILNIYLPPKAVLKNFCDRISAKNIL